MYTKCQNELEKRKEGRRKQIKMQNNQKIYEKRVKLIVIGSGTGDKMKEERNLQMRRK